MPGTALGHAELVSAEPAANSVLPEPPTRLLLRFSEEIDASAARVRLLDARQAELELGPAQVGTDGVTLTVELPELEPATYTVAYQVVSAVDGHATSGIFAFLVDPTGIQPPPAGAPSSSSPTSSPVAVVARWAGLLGLLGTAGISLFWLASGLPVLSAAGGAGVRREGAWVALAGFALLGFAGLAAYLTLTAAALGAGAGHGGFPLDFAAPFGWTPFAVAMRVALAGAFASFALAAGRWVLLDEAGRLHGVAAAALSTAPPTGGRWDAPMVAAAGILAAIGLLGASLAGHAASLGEPINAAVDWLHLLSVSAWIGTLPGLLLFALVTRHLSGEQRGALRSAVLRRHARVALLAAPVVALTGLANSPLVLGEPQNLVAAGYGNLLLAKSLLFAAAVGIGAANFLLGRARGAGRALPLVGVELLIGALAILVGATMVTVQPAASRAPVLDAPTGMGTAHLYGAADGASVHVAVNVPAPGAQRYLVSVADLDSGEPLPDVQRVFLVFSPPSGSELSAERVQLEPGEAPWIYSASGAYTPLVGEWRLEVIVRRAGERDASTTFQLEVNDQVAPEPVPPPPDGVQPPALLLAAWSLLPLGPAAWLVPLAPLAALASVLAVAASRGRRSGRGRRVDGLGPASVVAPALAALGVAALVLVGSRAVVQAANAAPLAEAARTSPVEADGASVELGQRLYAANCSGCHGADGAGEGPQSDRRLEPLGWVVPRRTDGELEWTIERGVVGTEMPPFANQLTEDERWHLVNYLRLVFGTPE